MSSSSRVLVSGRPRRLLAGLVMGWLLASALTVQAQYDGDGQGFTLAGDSFVTNDVFVVGPLYSYDQLTILSGGVLTSAGGALGISGIDTNGVFNPAVHNSAVVANSNSFWNNQGGDLNIGLSGGFSRLVVSNSGAVLSGTGRVGWYATNAGYNSVLITGAGSFWSNSISEFLLGNSGSSNTLVINDHASLFTPGVTVAGNGNNVWVSDSGSVWASTSGSFTVQGSLNSVVISNGGKVSVGVGAVGYNNNYYSSNNTVVVTGPGTVWTNSSGSGFSVGFEGAGHSLTISETGTLAAATMAVGYGGEGRNNLMVSNGGRLFTYGVSMGGTPFGAILGYNGGANSNTACVTGSGSIWSNASAFYLGYEGGSNSLAVRDGGTVINGTAFVGGSVGHNSAVVTDDRSTWINNGYLYVGNRGPSNTLVVSNAATVSALTAYVGADSMNNRALVTERHSVWTNSGNLYVGSGGSFNSLVISNYGGVMNGSAYVGYFATDRTNSVVLADFDATWQNNGTLYIGFDGASNTLANLKDGKVFDSAAFVGSGSSASNNLVLVSGGDSVWFNTNGLTVGDSGSFNSLVISSGGTAFDTSGHIGVAASAGGNSVVVTDTDSAWTNSSVLNLGEGGFLNSLVISNHGTVMSGTCTVGALIFGSSNLVVVTDAGSFFNNALTVGNSGPYNTMVISNQGMVINGSCTLGTLASAEENLVLVTDSGLLGNNTLSVGGGSPLNSLLVSNFGRVTNNTCYVGGGGGADSNSVVVNGPGATWLNNNSLIVGSNSSFNSFVISNGGIISVGSAYLGIGAGSSDNSVLVTGVSSFWTSGGDLHVGVSGPYNSLAASGGGTIEARNIYVGESKTNSGNSITINGSTLMAAQTLDLIQGTLYLINGSVDVSSLLVTNANGGQLYMSGGTFSTGATLMTNNGILIVGDAVRATTYQLKGGVHTFADGLEIRDQATLMGCGTVNGKVVVDPGGKVLSTCDGLIFAGPVTNNGTMVAANFHVIETKGILVNNGVIVFNYAGTNFQGGFINNGTLLDAGDTTILKAAPSGQDFVIEIQSNTNLTYQLQYSSTLGSGVGTPIGAPTHGNGGVLTLTDPGGATASSRFYKVAIGGF